MLKTILCSLFLGLSFLLQAQQLDPKGALKNFQIASIPLRPLVASMGQKEFLQPLPNGHVLYGEYSKPLLEGYWSLSVLDTQLNVVAKSKFNFKELIGSKQIYKTDIQRLGDKIYWITEMEGNKSEERAISCFEIQPNATVLSPKIVASGPRPIDNTLLGFQIGAPNKDELGYQIVGDKLVAYSAIFNKDKKVYDCDIRVYDADLKLLQQKKFILKEKWLHTQFVLDADLNLYMLSFSDEIEAARAKKSASGVEYDAKKSNKYKHLKLWRVDDTQLTNLAVDWKYLPRSFLVVSKPLSNELILVGGYNNMPSWEAKSKQWYYWKGAKPGVNEASGLFYLRLDLPSAKEVYLNYEPFSEKVLNHAMVPPDEIQNGLGLPIDMIQFIELKEHLVVATSWVVKTEAYTSQSLGRSPTIDYPTTYGSQPIWVAILDKSGKIVHQHLIPNRMVTSVQSYTDFKLFKQEEEAVLLYNNHPKNRTKTPKNYNNIKIGVLGSTETCWTSFNLDGTMKCSPVFDPNQLNYCMRTNSKYTCFVSPNSLWSIVLQPGLLRKQLFLVKITK